MASESKLHFLLIPHLAPGHAIPMIDIAKLLVHQPNVAVTVATTPLNVIRYTPTLAGPINAGLPITFLHLPFPAAEAGLPEGCESTDTLPGVHFAPNFVAAIGMLQQKLEERFPTLDPPPSCIVSDKYMHWTGDTADKFGIPRVMFDGMSCFNELCVHNLYASKVFDGLPDSVPFVVPGVPGRIQLTRAQLPPEFNPGSVDIGAFRQRAREAELRAYGVVINTFEELEQEYINEYKKLRGGKVWCLGPVALCNDADSVKAQRGKKASIDEHKCLEWLDSKAPGSVVYSCFGSIVGITIPQFIELGLGLEASNRPFIWVVRFRDGEKAKAFEGWLKESGFEERTKDRGLVIRDWAPQVLILSHSSVGVFLTHCGWNSTLEGVCAGVPMITWPQFADQFINEKLVVDVLGIGVGVGVQAVVHVGEEDRFGVTVTREKVTEAIEKVMDEGVEGNERRKKAKETGEIANAAIKEGGSSHRNLKLFVQDIMDHGEAGN